MNVDPDAAARVVHVLGVVVWIGGVAFMTAVVLPSLKRLDPERRALMLEAVEGRFAWIARVMVLFVGASGFYMVWSLDLWDRFQHLSGWWMDAMIAVWLVFAALLFVLEPLVLHRRFLERIRREPDRALVTMQRFHWLLLAASLITIAGATAGAHGYTLF